MNDRWSLRDAFAHFEARATNPVWSWSAASADNRTIVLTLWEDEIAGDGSVDFYGHPALGFWSPQLGNRDRIKNLIKARENADGKFRVVLIKAKDPSALPRSIKCLYPDEQLIMRLVSLDEATGEFRAIPAQR